MGDGDATAIGGNHFIHAARRNLNLTAIIINNSNYGMTGGQYLPDHALRRGVDHLALRPRRAPFLHRRTGRHRGAAWVGRGTVYHATLLDQLIETAILKRGFAVVEAMSHCHTLFGRKNRLGGPVEMMRRQKELAVRVEKAATMSPEELAGKITIGVLTLIRPSSHLHPGISQASGTGPPSHGRGGARFLKKGHYRISVKLLIDNN